VAEGGQLTPEQIAEELRKLRVADLLVAHATTLAQVAYAKLGERDIDQARLAIDALRAVVPVLAGSLPEQAQRDLQQVVANLQLAFASVASQPAEEPAEAAAPEEPTGAAATEPEQPEPSPRPDDAEESAEAGEDGEREERAEPDGAGG